MTSKYYKKKIDVKKHKRYDPRNKKKVNVSNYEREQQFRQFKNIPMEEAREFFEKRSPLQKKIDLGIEARRMFALPNELWLNIPNVVDVWGIDGYDPPIVPFLPKNALPYEIVNFKDEIWVANESGKFTTPEKDLKDVEKYQKPPKPAKIRAVIEDYDTEDKRKEFEKFTKKNALWQDKITTQYKKWLREDRDYEKIASKLSLKTSDLKLNELKEFYVNLKISDKRLKRIMFKVYNNKYKSEANSYTKDFQDFFDRRYYDLLEAKIKSEAIRIKKLNADPKKIRKAKETYYTKAMFNFRFPTLRKMADSQDYSNISDFDIATTLRAYPKWENEDIIADLIQDYNAHQLTDSDVPEEYEDLLREKKAWTDQELHMAKTTKEYNRTYLIQWKLEREMQKKDPVAYEKFKKEELERWRLSIPELTKAQLVGAY